MTDEQIKEQVIKVLSEEFELDPNELKPEVKLYEDLGLDSLDAVDMVVALEKNFGMKMTDEEALRAVRTLEDLFNLIKKLKNNNK